MSNNSISIDTNQFDSILQRLDAIIRITALTLPKEMTQEQKIEILDETGLSNKAIANLLGTTGGTVQTALNRIRKKGKTK